MSFLDRHTVCGFCSKIWVIHSIKYCH